MFELLYRLVKGQKEIDVTPAVISPQPIAEYLAGRPQPVGLQDLLASNNQGYLLRTEHGIEISKDVPSLPTIDPSGELKGDLLIVEPRRYHVLLGAEVQKLEDTVLFTADARWKGYHSDEIFTCEQKAIPKLTIPYSRLEECTVYRIDRPLAHIGINEKGSLTIRYMYPTGKKTPKTAVAPVRKGLFARLFQAYSN